MKETIRTGDYDYNKHNCNNYFKRKIFQLETDHERVYNLIKDNSIVLDFGCGDCSFFDYMKKKNKNISMIGYDIDPKYIKVGKNKGYKVYNSFNFDEKFDYIVSNQVVEHFDIDQLNLF